MSDVNYLIDFFKSESHAGLDISKNVSADESADWIELAQKSADFAQRLESNSDLAAFADYFKTVDFACKTVMLETLEQDAERPDLAMLLDESYAN